MSPEEKQVLDEQVSLEQKEIESAPKVPVTALQPSAHQHAGRGRCANCGQWSEHLIEAHDFLTNPNGTFLVRERYLGRNCCGGRYAI